MRTNVAIFSFLICLAPVNSAHAGPVVLGEAAHFALLTSSNLNIINGPLGVVTIAGDVGGTLAIIGDAPTITGDTNPGTTATALTDLDTMITGISGASADNSYSSQPTGTITPGVYDLTGSATTIDGLNITLDGSGDYIFRGSTLTFNSITNIAFADGAEADRIFWYSPGAINSASGGYTLPGNLVSSSTITLTNSATLAFTLNGRALSDSVITLTNGSIGTSDVGDFSPVPEPSTFGLGIAGAFAGVVAWRTRRSARTASM